MLLHMNHAMAESGDSRAAVGCGCVKDLAFLCRFSTQILLPQAYVSPVQGQYELFQVETRWFSDEKLLIRLHLLHPSK